MTPEEIKKQKEELLDSIKKQATDTTNDVVKSQLEELEAKIEEKLEKASTAESVEELKKSLNKDIAELQAELKKLSQIEGNEARDMNIHEAIKSAITENGEALKGYKGGKESLAIKSISFAGTALANQTTEVRRDLYLSPYNPIYLRNIFPNVTTESDSVVIPQIQAHTGAVGYWKEDQLDTNEQPVEKPEVQTVYKDVAVDIDWLAGITHVDRRLLLNVGYLANSIPNTLLYSRVGLFAAENAKITAYIAQFAQAYAGAKTIAIEKIIDAAFVQLMGNYFNPTHVLMNPADYVEHIKLNKAQGSGEYDQPNDMLRGFSSTGLEANVQIVPVPTLAAGTAYVIAANEFEFINRLSPELAISEHHDKNFTFNKVTFRVEELAGFVAKDLNAMVKVVL